MSETYAVSLPHADDGEFNADASRRDMDVKKDSTITERIMAIPRLRVDLGSAEVLREAGNFPWLAHVVSYFFGMETCGSRMRPWQRIRHIFASSLMYSAMALIIWLLSGVVFGFSEGVAIALGLAIFLNFMIFMVPFEQIMWEDALLAQYLQDCREENMKKKHCGSMVSYAIWPVFFFVLPIAGFVLPVLVSPERERISTSVQWGCWLCFANSIWITPMFVGFGPVAESLMTRYGKYLTVDLTKDYADRFLAVLCDDTLGTIDDRRKLLTALYERRGRQIKLALGRAVMRSHAQVPFLIVWTVVSTIWLAPGIVGGLPNAKQAIAPFPALRVGCAISVLLSCTGEMGLFSLQRLSKPNVLFEERLRSEISPHATKLA